MKVTIDDAPTCAELESAVDVRSIIAAIGTTPGASNVRVHVLPCDGGYVVNLMAAGVVTGAQARRMVAGYRRYLAVVERAKEAEAQTASEAIQEACGDGSPVGWRRDITKEGA